MLSLAAGAMEELSKGSPSGEVLEYKTKDFVKTVEVGVGGAGIIFGSQFQFSWHCALRPTLLESSLYTHTLSLCLRDTLPLPALLCVGLCILISFSKKAEEQSCHRAVFHCVDP